MTAVRTRSLLDALSQDVRYAVRLLMRTPGFTVVAVLILALGIGANTSIFSVVSAVLLKPLPFAEADRLVFLWEETKSGGGLAGHSTVAPANYVDWKERSRSFEDMALYNGLQEYNLTGDGDPEHIGAIVATPNLFSVLRLTPILGRTFSAGDEGANGTPVVVLSRTLWVRRFGADPGVIGRDILLDGVKHTVIGVVPPAFNYPSKKAEVYVPTSFTPDELASRGNHCLWVVGRLKLGVTVAEAQAEMSAVAKSLAKDYPESNTNLGAAVVPLRAELASGAALLGESDVRDTLFVLLAAVAVVLLITCANIANLLLARGAARRRELAVRQALGANHARVLRQLLTESIVLASLGLVIGIAFSAASLGYLSRLIPGTLPTGTAPAIDLRVLGFTCGVTFFTALLFGVGPALAAARVDFANAVTRGVGRGAGPRGALARNALVTGEIALTVMLLAAAGLLLRSYSRLLDVDPGFRPDRLLVAETDWSPSKYGDAGSRKAFYASVLERTRALPGVTSAGFVTNPPLMFLGGRAFIAAEGQPLPEAGDFARNIASGRGVSTGYLETLGVPLIRGRGFDSRDSADAAPTAMINEALAKMRWPGEDPVGRRFRFGFPNAPWMTVVGVVGDMKQMGLDAAPFPEFYLPAEQAVIESYLWPRYLVVRTKDDPLSLATAVREVVREVDPDQPVGVRLMSDVFDAAVGNRATQLTLVGGFAVLGLLLASIGLFGVLSYTVAQRTSEIGLRMALGAQRANVVGSVVRSALLTAVVGLAVGLAGSIALSRLLASSLFGVQPRDPATLAAVSMVVLVVTLVASYLPARRAAGVDPVSALRTE
jgi:putative ABC transport system permease protein